jgi:hypothetical protein
VIRPRIWTSRSSERPTKCSVRIHATIAPNIAARVDNASRTLDGREPHRRDEATNAELIRTAASIKPHMCVS